MEKNNTSFKVDLSRIHLGRRPGISGMMRVKNDAEFIDACVESCIDALDELVIVYNGCTDASPERIKALAARHPDKIRVYHYELELYCGSLTREQYEAARNLPADSEALLANYYNYALAKTTRSHVMKIDADQIYFPAALRRLCDAVRGASLRRISPADLPRFFKLAKLMRYFDWKIGDNTPREFESYRKVLVYFCAKGLLSVSLSGINVFFHGDRRYIPQGLKTGGLNILGQFNGTGDHLLFKVRKGTRFVPYDCTEYSTLTSANYTYIEKLVGEPRGFSYGFMWWHLNAMRCGIYARQTENLRLHPEAFVEAGEYLSRTPREILDSINPDFLHPLAGVNFAFYMANSRDEVDPAALRDYTFDPENGLSRRKDFRQ